MHCVGGDFYVAIDHAGCREKDGDTLGHQFVALAHPHLIVDERKFGAGVGAKNFDGVLGFPDDDALPGLAQNFGHVGQVVLRVGIGGGKLLDMLEQ